MGTLLKDVPFESIPRCLGGGFDQYNEPYDFDLSDTGCFYYQGAPAAPKRAVTLTQLSSRTGIEEVASIKLANETKSFALLNAEPVPVGNDKESVVDSALSHASPLHQNFAAVFLASVAIELRAVCLASPLLCILVVSLIVKFCCEHFVQVAIVMLPVAVFYLLLNCLLTYYM